MPSYFFHLLFELYHASTPSLQDLPLSPTTTNEITASHGDLVLNSTDDLWRPVKPRKDSTLAKEKQKETEKPKRRDSVRTAETERYLDARFGRLTLKSVDMVSANTSQQQARKGSVSVTTTNKDVPVAGPASTTTTGGVGMSVGGFGVGAPRAKFIPVENNETDIGFGIVHLYRDNEPSAVLEGMAKETKEEEEEALKTVAILAVPSYMAPSDLLGFVGERTVEAVSHFRMIRTAKANRYMVLMKFREKDEARWFVDNFNGSVFNSMEPENCHCVFVKSIRFTSSQPGPSETYLATSPTASTGISSTALSTKPAPPPTPALTELPTCPVCLERMDDTITGLLTILCQHVFHCACLSKWKDSSCPVCRYTQHTIRRRRTSLALHSASASATGSDDEDEDSEEEDDEELFCYSCAADSNLWICLICGNIGCGRYDSAHAYAHFQSTQHSYAMDLDTQRVWDYLGDGYVHRLLQNKSDGKLVELPSSSRPYGGGEEYEQDSVPVEKVEKMTMEYTHLLSSQLDSQRAYYEEIVAKAADKSATLTTQLTAVQSQLTTTTSALNTLQAQHESLTHELRDLQKSKSKLETRSKKLEELARKWEKEAREEKSMNEGLVERVNLLGKELEKEREERKELGEQVRDLMVYLEAREKVGEGTEGEGGDLVITEGRKKGKGRRK
ncbi:zf-UBP-domain-containing protein [Ascobolus immersus RN42]|uniref:Zf-UBP-domain-containing protein n=1 Tax=Ascobolus immersus RN42 TaxID=1160509 RepID=A0A3N4HI31_ASCIM|nr:zf-UBP-domain-containing protein [Ascobolus immersus RN42]